MGSCVCAIVLLLIEDEQTGLTVIEEKEEAATQSNNTLQHRQYYDFFPKPNEISFHGRSLPPTHTTHFSVSFVVVRVCPFRPPCFLFLCLSPSVFFPRVSVYMSMASARLPVCCRSDQIIMFIFPSVRVESKRIAREPPYHTVRPRSAPQIQKTS